MLWAQLEVYWSILTAERQHTHSYSSYEHRAGGHLLIRNSKHLHKDCAVFQYQAQGNLPTTGQRPLLREPQLTAWCKSHQYLDPFSFNVIKNVSYTWMFPNKRLNLNIQNIHSCWSDPMQSPIPLTVSSFRGITVSYETSTSGTPSSPSGFTPQPSPLPWATSSGPRASSTPWPGTTYLVSSKMTSCLSPYHVTERFFFFESQSQSLWLVP